MVDQNLLKRVNAAVQDPRYRDILNMVAAAEGGDYNTRFGGAKITDLSRHPGLSTSYIDKNGKRIASTASGRYQFVQRTWNSIAKQLGLTDFSPESQDKAAVALILQAGAGKAVEDGDLPGAVLKLRNTWTSLTGSPIGSQHHATRTPEFLVGAYNASRVARGEQPLSVKWWNGSTYNNATTTSSGNSAQPRTMITMPYGLDPNSLVGQVMARVFSNEYAQEGDIMHRMGLGDRLAVSANPVLTPDTQRELLNRLYGGEHGYGGRYGMSFVGGSLRPTVYATRPDTGEPINLIEYPNGVYINSATGERMTSDGLPYVEPAPAPEAEPAPVSVPAADAAEQFPPSSSPTAGTDAEPTAQIQPAMSAQDYIISNTAPQSDDPFRINAYNNPVGQLIADYLRQV